MNTATERSGFALPAALLALVIVGALVTGGVYAAMEEDRSSANVQFGQHAFLAAERGLEDLLGTKTRLYFQDTMGVPGTTDTLGPVAVEIEGVQAQYTLYVQRLNTRLFKVDSEGEVLSGGRYAGSKRRLAEMMRITYTYVPKDRAFVTQEPIRLRGQSGISGVDTIPSGWTECDDLGSQTAVLAKDSTAIDIVGASSLEGTPKKKQDATLDSAAFSEYGDMNLDDLKVIADKVYPPGTYNGMGPVVDGSGACDKTVMPNWGDPNNPAGACHYYWPIIHATGDMTLGSGVGQGILIVDGNLHISGNFQFTGLVFVYGSISTTGVGNKLTGSVNVLGAGLTDIGQPTGGGSTQIKLSSCAIERAHLYNERFNRPLPLKHRKFTDLSGIGAS
ncbi:MAG TPA: hypothetical protein VMM12_13500 [Longimicrobiales bacterium]|nr:hypothetical protein [Longimicrobiales bacterium]